MNRLNDQLIRIRLAPLNGHCDLYQRKSLTMRLNLTLNGILVASLPLNPSRCKDEFYLQALRQQILQQNRDTLSLIPAKPFFYIEVPASSASLSYGQKGNA